MYSEMVSDFEEKKVRVPFALCGALLSSSPQRVAFHCVAVVLQQVARALSGKDSKIDSLMQELLSARATVRDRERSIASFQAMAEQLIHVDHKDLQEAVRELYAQVTWRGVAWRGVVWCCTLMQYALAAVLRSDRFSVSLPRGTQVTNPNSRKKKLKTAKKPVTSVELQEAHALEASMSKTTPAAIGGARSTDASSPGLSAVSRPKQQEGVSLKEHLETVEGTSLTPSLSLSLLSLSLCLLSPLCSPWLPWAVSGAGCCCVSSSFAL
jgi:hypothetical protein